MSYKVTVSGPDGQAIEEIVELQHEGELSKAVGRAMDQYRKIYPDAPPFQKTIKVTKV